MYLVSRGPGHYELEGDPNGTFIMLDHTFQTECDEPHPCKMRVDDLANFYTDGGEKFCRGKRRFFKKTKAGVVEYVSWYCDGGEEHHYSQWVVMVDGDWTENVYDTFAEARSVLEAAIGKVTLKREKTLHYIVETFEHFILRDEYEALGRNIESFERMLTTDDAMFVDRNALLKQWLRREDLARKLAL